MLKTYTLSNTSEFKTITIPKGTLLFRGISFTEDTPTEYMSEFFSKGLCIPPTKNIYFYPAPYAGIGVNPFNVYILYSTNYDLELLLLVKPSQHFKSNSSEINTSSESFITICNKLSEDDACGRKMSYDDICFTEEFINTFPHILGYVGLDGSDVDAFLNHYRTMLKYGMTDKIKQILPSIVENSRGFTGIPEIVLHPLHLRRLQTARFRHDFRQPDTWINAILETRARYNYTPLLYITNDNIFTLKDLLNDVNILKMRDSQSSDYVISNPLFERMNILIKQLLSDGYRIDGCLYKLKIESSTGFYKIITNETRNTKTRKYKYNTMINFDPSTMTDTSALLSYSVHSNIPNDTLTNITIPYFIDAKESDLNSKLKSLTSGLVLNKGNYRRKYRVEDVFKRKELQSPIRYTQRRKTRRLHLRS
jgi:hypothetical protein